jgi:thiaminase
VIANAHAGIVDGLGTIYACERAYLDTWTTVLPSVPKGSRWHDWVANWTQDAFREVVDALGECVDELVGPDPSEEIKQRMHAGFRGVALFELAFWEMSYKQQGWPSLNSKKETPNV